MRAAKQHMDRMHLSTVFLLTDSSATIDEAIACPIDHPDVCTGVRFRYIDKHRWVGAEGGWENPFPSGSHAEVRT